MLTNAHIHLLNHFAPDRETEIRQPLLAAVTVGVMIMAVTFILGLFVSLLLALFGVEWGVESTVRLALMTGCLSTAVTATVFLRHNYRIAHRSYESHSFTERACDVVCDIATALFGGLCVALFSLVLAYFAGILVLLFWPGLIGSIDRQRQLIVYPPIIVGIPAFVAGSVGFLIHEWRLERNWRGRGKAHPTH